MNVGLHRAANPVDAAACQIAAFLRRLPVIGGLPPASLVSRAGIAVLSLIFVQPTHAYIGPGLGLGAIAVALGGVGFFLFVLFTALWYPFKRLLRRRRAKTAAALRPGDEPHADSGAEDDIQR